MDAIRKEAVDYRETLLACSDLIEQSEHPELAAACRDAADWLLTWAPTPAHARVIHVMNITLLESLRPWTDLSRTADIEAPAEIRVTIEVDGRPGGRVATAAFSSPEFLSRLLDELTRDDPTRP